MSNFVESEHPRDDIGRFTYKNGGASSSSTLLEGKIEKQYNPNEQKEEKDIYTQDLIKEI